MSATCPKPVPLREFLPPFLLSALRLLACMRVCSVTPVMSDCAYPWTIAHQAPLSMRFSRQEYWSGFPCSPSGDLRDPGIKPISYISCIGRWVLYHSCHLETPEPPCCPSFWQACRVWSRAPGGQGQVTDESSVWIPVAWMRFQLRSAQDRAGHVPSESLSLGCLLGQRTAQERASGRSPGAARWPPSVQGDPAQPSLGTALPPYASSLTPWHIRVSSLLVSSAGTPSPSGSRDLAPSGGSSSSQPVLTLLHRSPHPP